MKTKLSPAQILGSILFLLLAAVPFTACKSSTKVDWNSRVGTYTYDEAVTSLGPPDKSTQLSDGRTVADWVHHSGGGLSFGIGTGFSSGHTGVGVGQSIVTGYADKVLRLTFGADNKLVSWTKNY